MSAGFGASGTQSQAAGNASLTPSYPTSPPAGALFQLRFGHSNDATQASASYSVPAGWTARFTAEASLNCRQWVYTRDAAATGSESGSITITVSGGNASATHAAQIDYITGADVSNPIHVSAASYENAGADPSTDGNLTTTVDGALACQACIHAGSANIVQLTGGTGGTYTNQNGNGGAATPRISIQTAPVATAGSISGFSYNKGSGGRWGIRGYAIKPSTPITYSIPVITYSSTIRAPKLQYIFKPPVITYSSTIRAPKLQYIFKLPVITYSSTVQAPKLQYIFKLPVITYSSTVQAPKLQYIFKPPVITYSSTVQAPKLQNIISIPTISYTSTVEAPSLIQEMPPIYVGVGTYSQKSDGSDLTPGYPSTEENDTLYLLCDHINSSSQLAATYDFPNDWELLYTDQVASQRLFILRKIADGTETGTITITVTGGIAVDHQAVIVNFRGAELNNLEGASSSSGTGTTVSDAAVTTTGTNRLAVQFGAISPSQNASSFTGESNGDWSLNSQSSSSPARLFIQTATIDTATTIGGGTFTKSGTGSWIIRGFALLPTAIGNTKTIPSITYTQIINVPNLINYYALSEVSYSSIVQEPSIQYIVKIPTITYTSIIKPPAIVVGNALPVIEFTSTIHPPTIGTQVISLPLINDTSQQVLPPSLTYIYNVPAIDYNSVIEVISLQYAHAIPTLEITSTIEIVNIQFQFNIETIGYSISINAPNIQYKFTPPLLSYNETIYAPSLTYILTFPTIEYVSTIEQILIGGANVQVLFNLAIQDTRELTLDTSISVSDNLQLQIQTDLSVYVISSVSVSFDLAAFLSTPGSSRVISGNSEDRIIADTVSNHSIVGLPESRVIT